MHKLVLSVSQAIQEPYWLLLQCHMLKPETSKGGPWGVHLFQGQCPDLVLLNSIKHRYLI